MVWLSGLLPYEQCEAVFAEIGEQWHSSSSIWRQMQRHGERLQKTVEHQRDQVSVEHVVLPDVSMTSAKGSQWMAAWSTFVMRVGAS